MKDPNHTLQKLLAMVDVSTERQKFGPEGEPGVNVILPINYATAGARESVHLPLATTLCQLQSGANGFTDI